jgi:hypothetical protein
MHSSLGAFLSAMIASAARRIRRLQRHLTDQGFGESSDPLAGVREPNKRGPGGGRLAVALREPEAVSRVEAIARR